jgi:MFS family permease
LVAVVCAAQVLAQIGAYCWPALLPSMMPLWGLSNSEAGWITGVFYLAYMVSVPLLVTSTDKVDPRRVYLFGIACTVLSHLLFGWLAEGFWSALALRALAGVGWAGTYMTGLKLLADQVDPKSMSRAVTGHAASIGISGALSYAWAGTLASSFGWQSAFVMSGMAGAAAFILVSAYVPARVLTSAPGGRALFDFLPVLRNRSAMAYSLAYCVHTLEMNALRGWGVAFLGFAAAGVGGDALLAPALVMTALALLGTMTSVVGNEAAIRIGRRRLITIAMAASAAVGAGIGFIGATSYGLAAGLLLLYGALIWLDSSSLTAGTAGNAEPARRGATLAVHSSLGYAGGFVGPLLIGFTLDLSGGMSAAGWGLAFLSISALVLLTLVGFLWLRPSELAGDRRGL